MTRSTKLGTKSGTKSAGTKYYTARSPTVRKRRRSVVSRRRSGWNRAATILRPWMIGSKIMHKLHYTVQDTQQQPDYGPAMSMRR